METLPLPKVPENAPIYESWDRAAKRLLSTLWKCSQAWIFHEPVDPDRLGIPDYLTIVKTPMDFGTIKQRLHSNSHYHRMQDFLDDMELVFENCRRFNGEESSVGRMCRAVREEFRLYDQLNIEFYL